MSKNRKQRSLPVSANRLASSFVIRYSALATLQRNAAKVFADPGFFENVEQGRARLGELLTSKALLLVLDDVWERTHAEALNDSAQLN